MKIKICGITNIQDALDAIQAGASALGFVFYENSPRYIQPSVAKQIIDTLPPFVQSVGLFVNEPASKIDFICKYVKIDLAQIHFDQNELFFNSLTTKHIKVIRAKTKEDILKYKDQYKIVDAFVESYGGEGKKIDLNWFDNIDCSKIILAGGLDSENIKALKKYNFYALDVSSGVEISKGKKSKEKIEKFIKVANELYR
jgi:phosphoribosylanthranilate isomerase